MTAVNSNDEAIQAKYELERAMIDCRAWQLMADGQVISGLTDDNHEFSVEWGKLIFAWWDDQNSRSWRITGYQIDGAEIQLQAARGMARQPVNLVLRNEARWREQAEFENLKIGERRIIYAQLLSQLLTGHFKNSRLLGLTTGADRSRSVLGRHTRLALKAGGETILAIGAGDAESQSDVDRIVASGLIWLANFNRDKDAFARARRLCYCLPSGRAQTVIERLVMLDFSKLPGQLDARIECYEVNERRAELISTAMASQSELLNLHPREIDWPENLQVETVWRERILDLAPEIIESRNIAGRESYSVNGLEFARYIAGENPRVTFGVAGLPAETKTAGHQTLTEANFHRLEKLVAEIVRRRNAHAVDRHHPYYRLREEAWLESMLRREISLLDSKLDDRYVYSQIPAWRGDERSVIDLLTVTFDGQLAVIEIKASEDPQLPLQGLDYWLRVEQARIRGEFHRRGLFAGIELADKPPLLYLVAPRLRFHRTFAIVARCLSPEIKAFQVGINTNWREGIRVRSIERINPEKSSEQIE